MTENFNSIYPNANREPWNKGKLIGPKPPLRPKHVWAIRTKLQLERDTRDLALFIDLDSQISDSTFNLGVAKRQLNRPQIAGSFVNQFRSRSAERMGPI